MDKSNYFNTLPNEVQVRYLEKLTLTNNVDPYLLKFTQCSNNVQDFPKVAFFDIIEYFVYQKSAYTDKEFRAYKSLDAYNYFICKWVKKLGVKAISNSDRILVISQDSLTYGLVYGFISPYILQLDGSHVSVGILAVGNLIGDLLAPDVTKLFTHIHGKKYALFFILNISIVTHLMMVLTWSHWFTILVRILFSMTNQSQNLCQELLLNKATSEENKETLRRNFSLLSGAGYILGPVISGYLFKIGFGYIGILASAFSYINARLLVGVTKDKKDANLEHIEKSVLAKACGKVIENMQELEKCNLKKHWDILFVKYLFAGSVLIFFSKFTQIMKYNYDASSILIGYTSAYINILVFVATYYISVLRQKTHNYSHMFVTEVSFLFTLIFMLLSFYAPVYELYMIVLAPIIFLRALILDIWNDFSFERKNDSLLKLSNSASVFAGLTIPIFFGILCDQIAHDAVIIFSCVPMFLCWLILMLYSKNLKLDSD